MTTASGHVLRHVLRGAVIAGVVCAGTLPTTSAAKAPGVSHCYRSVCHRVRTIEETGRLVGRTLVVQASHYDHPRFDRFNAGKFTSNGERFDAADPARVASADLPDGTELLLRNPANGHVSHVRVNDFGPFRGNRRLDVTRRVAEDLGFSRRGVAEIEVVVVAPPQPDDLRYRRNRPRLPARGHLGVVAQLEMAGLVDALIAERNRPVEMEVAEIATAALDTGDVEVEAFAALPASDTTSMDQARSTGAGDLPIEIAGVGAFETSHAMNAERPNGGAPRTEPRAPMADTGWLVPSGTTVAADADGPVLPMPAAADEAFVLVALEAPVLPPATSVLPGTAIATVMAPDVLARTDTGQAGFGWRPEGWAANGRHGLLIFLMALLTSTLLALAADGGTTARSLSVRRQSRSPGVLRLPLEVEGHASMTIFSTAAVSSGAVAAPRAREFEPPQLGSLLGKDVEVEGIVRSGGRLSIAGRVRGRIEAHHLVILPGGFVEGQIEAGTVEIAGTFAGQISADAIAIGNTGHINGEIAYRSIAVAQGAVVDADFRQLRQPPT